MLIGSAPTSIIARLASTESGSFFFQPLQFHLEAANLPVELYLPFLWLSVGAGPIAAEDSTPSLQQLALPLAHLRGTYAVLAGQFVDRLQPLRPLPGPVGT